MFINYMFYVIYLYVYTYIEREKSRVVVYGRVFIILCGFGFKF